MKLYFSGHLHLYERTHPICYNGTFLAKKDSKYDMSCPVYVIEGSGGNDRYMQTSDDCTLAFTQTRLKTSVPPLPTTQASAY